MHFTSCWFLTGPTASGKTALALKIARRLNAEIVSLDSMAIYRGMDIGTAKPTPDQRAEVPHHLIDIVEPADEFSLAEYVAAAERVVEEIRDRGRQPLFVGGTPLYLKGLLRGVFDGPAADPTLRQQLLLEAEHEPAGHLHRLLRAVDPSAADRLHPNDTRRLIRALEVYRATGVPISRWQQQFDRGLPAEACRVFALDWPRETLYGRIDGRVDAMFAEGLVEEVRQLLAHPLGATARQAVGYREVIEHLAGGPGLAETRELVKQHTRQLSKRQCTWFRSLCECRMLPMGPETDLDELAARVVADGRNANC